MKTPLQRALSALRDGRAADALEVLLEVWAEAPSSALAACIAQLSELARTDVPNIRGKTKAAIEAWTKAARAPRATDVPALLDAFADVLWRDAFARLALMRKWRPDPRVDELCVRMLETLPYRSTSKPFYTAVIELAARIRDPALFARIEAARHAVADNMTATLGDWLVRRFDELVPELRAAIAPPKPVPQELRDIGKLLAKAAASAAPRAELGALLDDIYADPDDTARRLVYADALLERGDVRGELIALQCQPALTAVQRRRERALMKQHGIEWLGKLAHIISTFEFERGFLAACRVESNKGSRIKPLVGHPAWATVHTLADSAQIALDPVMRALRTLTFHPNRARQRENLDDAWRELYAGRARLIESLYVTDLDNYADFDEQLALLGRCDALPNLRELHVGGALAHYFAELLRAPIAARAEAIGLHYDRYEQLPADLAPALRDASVRRLVVSHDETTMQLERGTTGYERATFDLEWDTQQILTLVQALPSTIRELRIRTRFDLDRSDLVALTSAARARKLDVFEVTGL